jgi:hypothetical protein
MILGLREWQGIDGSEPMQNDQEQFYSDIFLNFYNIIKL